MDGFDYKSLFRYFYKQSCKSYRNSILILESESSLIETIALIRLKDILFGEKALEMQCFQCNSGSTTI